MFYTISERSDGLVDVWLEPGEAVARYELNGRMEFDVRTLAVIGVDPKDPQWGGDLEDHIRRHYAAWVASAEVIII